MNANCTFDQYNVLTKLNGCYVRFSNSCWLLQLNDSQNVFADAETRPSTYTVSLARYGGESNANLDNASASVLQQLFQDM